MTAGMIGTGAPTLQAQTIIGYAVDDDRGSPVAGAVVRLLDRDGNERGQALADSAGRFVLSPPEPGEYSLEATRLGYQITRSPLLALTGIGTAELELIMVPAPIGLEGFEVEVDAVSEAEDQLRLAGIEPAELGNRFVSQEQIDAVEIKPDVGSVLEWSQIGGMRVLRPENTTTGSDKVGLCVSLARARTGQGRDRCAMVVWNGVQVDQISALAIDPASIGAMAVLTPIEAVILYGVRGEAGALVMWSRQGRAR
jgi:hypothetical protein